MRAVELNRQDIQTCSECGRQFTAAVPMTWCPPCHVYAEFMIFWSAIQYRRYGVLPY